MERSSVRLFDAVVNNWRALVDLVGRPGRPLADEFWVDEILSLVRIKHSHSKIFHRKFLVFFDFIFFRGERSRNNIFEGENVFVFFFFEFFDGYVHTYCQ